MKRTLLSAAIAFISCTIAFATRADTAGGGVFIPIQDGSGHTCIDVTKSNVSMSVITAQLKRTNEFWKKSKSMGVKIDVKLLNGLGQPFVFPRGRQVSVSSYRGDIGYLPMVFPITTKYSFVNPTDKKPYVNIGLDVFLLNMETKSGLANGIVNFIDFSKNLPLPVNPYTQGVQLFGEFAQQIIESDIESAEEKLPSAVFSFDLASNSRDVSQCESKNNSSWQYPILHDGIVAVIWDYNGKIEDGFIRVSEVDNFCYYPTTSKRISYSAKENGVCPKNGSQRFLNNPLLAFAIQSWSKDPSSVHSFDVQPIQGNANQPRLTYSTAEAAVKITRVHDDPKWLMNSEKVKVYFDAINEGNLQNVFSTERSEIEARGDPKQSFDRSVREVETAIALHRCGLVGIPANECI